jgi:hypothetical protein
MVEGTPTSGPSLVNDSLEDRAEKISDRSTAPVGIDHVPRDWACCVPCGRWVATEDDSRTYAKCGHDTFETGGQR